MFNITNQQGNANQNLNEVLPHGDRMAIIKRQETSVGEDLEKKEHLALLVEMNIAVVTMKYGLLELKLISFNSYVNKWHI